MNRGQASVKAICFRKNFTKFFTKNFCFDFIPCGDRYNTNENIRWRLSRLCRTMFWRCFALEWGREFQFVAFRIECWCMKKCVKILNQTICSFYRHAHITSGHDAHVIYDFAGRWHVLYYYVCIDTGVLQNIIFVLEISINVRNTFIRWLWFIRTSSFSERQTQRFIALF